MQSQTHSDLNVATFPELEALRAELGLSRARLCWMIEHSPSTYQRWIKWANGERGGHCPRPSSLRLLRKALADERARRESESMRKAS